VSGKVTTNPHKIATLMKTNPGTDVKYVKP